MISAGDDLKFFEDELSLRQNIANGCGGRIPPKQWAWLCENWKTEKAKAVSLKNKEARNSQDNALHTTGSRAFAVVNDQQEIMLGRRLGRAELYCLTHTNKDGDPVDAFSAGKIREIKEKLVADPTLIGEEAHQEDLYYTLFPKAKTSSRHGLGLVVGGKASEKLDQAIAALMQSQEENKDLRRMVETLKESHNCLVEKGEMVERKCSEMVERRCNEMMVIFQASLRQNSTQQESSRQENIIQEEAATKPDLEAKVEQVRLGQKEVEKTNPTKKICKVRKAETNVQSSKLMDSRIQVKQEEPFKATTAQVEKTSQDGDVKNKGNKKNVEERKLQSVETSSKKQKVEVLKIHKVKLEKVEANNVASNKGEQVIEIRIGMKVSLRSPNSLCLAAIGTVQNTDANVLGSDGKPLCDCVEVLVNYVCNKSTMLPRAHGRLEKMGSAEARCIPWPRIFINQTTKSEYNHVDIYKDHDKYLRKKPQSDNQNVAIDSESQAVSEKKKKRKRTSGDAMNTQDDEKTNSQVVEL